MTTPEPAPTPAPPGPGPVHPVTAQSTLTPRVFDSVVSTVLDNNEGMTVSMATRIVREAMAFIITGARRPDLAMAPSRLVDEGWHAFVLHTEAYAELCAREGVFVHHSPGFDPENFDPDILEQTQAAVRAEGFAVDPELWRAPTDDSLVSVAAKCQHAPSCSIKPMKKPEKPCKKPSKVA
ncbi:hypothetical protein [Kitasatospora sp. NPDC047058]|uniref:glycine-rich domain-containing protein n=1 Tax=Kitasatospora sp. NPDC047058 TaxID=3155620 RepID=UPI0033FF1074